MGRNYSAYNPKWFLPNIFKGSNDFSPHSHFLHFVLKICIISSPEQKAIEFKAYLFKTFTQWAPNTVSMLKQLLQMPLDLYLALCKGNIKEKGESSVLWDIYWSQ